MKFYIPGVCLGLNFWKNFSQNSLPDFENWNQENVLFFQKNLISWGFVAVTQNAGAEAK